MSMNKFVKEQLNKCKTKLPYWDDTTKEMIISNNITQSDFHIYIENYIMVEPPGSTFSKDWNNGTRPPEQYMCISIIDKSGDMYKVSGYGEDSHTHWVGWLPEGSFKVLQ